MCMWEGIEILCYLISFFGDVGVVIYILNFEYNLVFLG